MYVNYFYDGVREVWYVTYQSNRLRWRNAPNESSWLVPGTWGDD